MAIETEQGRALNWDDEISNDQPGFILLPEGEYKYTVTKYERGWFDGSTNLPPCNKCTLYLSIEATEGATMIQHNLFLHTKTEGFLCAFFNSIGQRQHGETLKMDWPKVTGSKGTAKIYIDIFAKKDGTEGKSNKVKKFLDPVEPKESKGYQPGVF